MSTHSPDGSVADDEELPVCEDCELSPPVLVPVFVLAVPSEDEEDDEDEDEDEDEPEVPVVVPVVPVVPVVVVVVLVPPVPAPAVPVEGSEPWDCEREPVVAACVREVTESVWTDDRVVVDAESAVRRCAPVFAAGVAVEGRCAVAGVAAGWASSEVGSSAMPMARGSGEVAAWVRVSDCWLIAVTVRPPPTRATAVATTALRWLFFHRARWRRRAARPSVTTGPSTTSSDATPGSVPAAGSSGSPASCHSGASSHAAAAVPVVV
ncbi:hypothetical protein [Streptomyces sp. NPDC093990]|uniref:hypothetical protein n=1 Tax=Streptomyces sp. NPDC093990 TaxID=3155306 RepID=UPI00341DAA1F